MTKHGDICVAVVEKYALDGANTFTLMKHKHKEHRHERRHHDYTIIMSTVMTSKYTYL